MKGADINSRKKARYVRWLQREKSWISSSIQQRFIEQSVAGVSARKVADLVGVNRNTASIIFETCEN